MIIGVQAGQLLSPKFGDMHKGFSLKGVWHEGVPCTFLHNYVPMCAFCPGHLGRGRSHRNAQESARTCKNTETRHLAHMHVTPLFIATPLVCIEVKLIDFGTAKDLENPQIKGSGNASRIASSHGCGLNWVRPVQQENRSKSLDSCQGHILAVWILAAKLSNSDVKFAVDVWVDLSLQFFQGKRPPNNQQKNPLQSSGNCSEKFPSDFLRKLSLKELSEAFGQKPLFSHRNGLRRDNLAL